MAKSEASIVDHTPDEQAPLTPAEKKAARLRELFIRFNGQGAPLTEAEKSELDALQLEEAEAAGHVVAEPPKPEAVRDAWHLDVLGLIDKLIAIVPAAHGLAADVAALRARHAGLSVKR